MRPVCWKERKGKDKERILRRNFMYFPPTKSQQAVTRDLRFIQSCHCNVDRNLLRQAYIALM
jgi:hypothetical protein